MTTIPNMLIRTITAVLLSTSLSSCSAQEIPKDWIAECVGRLQIALPGEADMRISSFNSFKEELLHSSGGLSQRYGGKITVSDALDQKQYVELENLIKKDIDNSRNFAKKQKKEDGSLRKFELLATDPQTGLAWHVDAAYRLFLKAENHVVWWQGSDLASDNQNTLPSQVSTLFNGLSYRAPNAVPHAPGVCLPYVFIQDDNGKRPYRSIRTTYNLKAHPDITITLEDSSAEDYTEYSNPSAREHEAKPDYLIDDFWTSYSLTTTLIGETKINSLWDFPIKRSVMLAGQKGLASFVKITRTERAYSAISSIQVSTTPTTTIDFGYFAAVRGDPKAKTDMPDLQLSVIQRSRDAKDKGIEPVSKEEFLKMVQTIAASVQRRPTQEIK